MITWPSPPQCSHVLFIVKKPCVIPDLAPAAARLADDRLKTGLDSRPLARAAAHLLGDLYLFLHPEDGLFELYLHVVAQVFAFAGPSALGPSEEVVEKVAEYVVEIPGEAEIVEAAGPVSATPKRSKLARFSESPSTS